MVYGAHNMCLSIFTMCADSAIVVWKLGDKLATPAKRMEDEEPQKEAWTAVHIMKYVHSHKKPDFQSCAWLTPANRSRSQWR